MKNGSVVIFSLILLYAGCKESALGPGAPRGVGGIDQYLPEFFLEKGSDVDSSYVSFRGTQRRNDTLQLEMTTWGVVEYGLFLRREYGPHSASYFLMGECGTVSTRTWKKVTLTHYLGAVEQDTLWKLSFSNLKDTLTIGKAESALGEK